MRSPVKQKISGFPKLKAFANIKCDLVMAHVTERKREDYKKRLVSHVLFLP